MNKGVFVVLILELLSSCSHKLERDPSSKALEEPCISDVKAQFSQIQKRGVLKKIQTGNYFVPKEYRFGLLRKNVKFGWENHFQGIHHINSRRFVISGANLEKKKSDLIFLNQGKVTKKIEVGGWPFWHAGGIDVFQDILSVPLERYRTNLTSKIIFFDVSNFENPKKLSFEINRKTEKGGALFYMRGEGEKYLLGLYDTKKIDFYESLSFQISQGFDEVPRFSWPIDSLTYGKEKEGRPFRAQNLDVVRQCDGQQFLISFDNTSKTVPFVIKGKDFATLYRIKFDGNEVKVHQVLQRSFKCGWKCDFSGGASAQISPEGKLYFTSVPFWRKKRGRYIYIVQFN